jgi:ADP-heptose:LPS heptosyltransferase
MDPQKRTIRQQWKTLRALRRESFDVAFNFSGADRTVFATAITGAKWRLAHPGGRWHFWNRWLIPHWTPRQPPAMPVFEQRRQMLATCGLKLEPPRWDLRLPQAAQHWAESALPPGAVHFSINASHPLKEWPLENWISLAKQLLASDAALRLVATGSGSPREQERLRAFAADVGDEQLTLPPAGLPIAELAAMLKRCRLHVGADSGVLHLATAVGTTVIALFRDYHDASAWMPPSPPHHVLTASCACVNQRQPPCAADGRARCLAEIAPGQVAALVQHTRTL